MKSSFCLWIGITLMVVGSPLAAQTATPPVDEKQVEQQRRDAETQMRDAQKRMRDAEKQMRDAEQSMREAARQIERTTRDKVRRDIERKVVVFGNHARLGLVLRHEKNPATDTVGAVIDALTPGSPAEEAGLQAGDIVTKFDGHSLTTGPVDADGESEPTARMMDLAKSLTDGQKVTLEVRRGDAARTVNVTARTGVGPKVRVFTSPHVEPPDIEDIEIPEMPEMPDIDVDVVLGRSWQDIDLVALNADLGEYFGTNEGLLVIRTPKDDGLKLKAGDVILKIGDRTPGSPSKAMRILRSYEGGESVPVQVLRKREKVTLSLQVPERHLGHMRHLTPAAPPAPAAAPAAPAKVPTRV